MVAEFAFLVVLGSRVQVLLLSSFCERHTSRVRMKGKCMEHVVMAYKAAAKVCSCMQTERVTELAKSVDPSRLVSGASGWHDKPCGDIIDMHAYLGPGQPSLLVLLLIIHGCLLQLVVPAVAETPLTGSRSAFTGCAALVTLDCLLWLLMPFVDKP